eukprot:60412-Hanusia_phi.AAC.1
MYVDLPHRHRPRPSPLALPRGASSPHSPGLGAPSHPIPLPGLYRLHHVPAAHHPPGPVLFLLYRRPHQDAVLQEPPCRPPAQPVVAHRPRFSPRQELVYQHARVLHVRRRQLPLDQPLLVLAGTCLSAGRACLPQPLQAPRHLRPLALRALVLSRRP